MSAHTHAHTRSQPVKFDGGLAFMFETSLLLKLTRFALDAPHRDRDYNDCWAGLPKVFDPTKKDGVKIPK